MFDFFKKKDPRAEQETALQEQPKEEAPQQEKKGFFSLSNLYVLYNP